MREECRTKRGLFAFLREKGKGRLLLLFGGAVLGVLLLLLGGGAFERAETVETPPLLREDANDLATHRASLEKEVADLCAAVHGVSSVKAMITLGSGCRIVYETDAKGDPITVGNGSNESVVYQTVKPPEIIGVGVVCKGGNDPQIQRQLIDLLSTALGISANRVTVVGK